MYKDVILIFNFHAFAMKVRRWLPSLPVCHTNPVLSPYTFASIAIYDFNIRPTVGVSVHRSSKILVSEIGPEPIHL